MTQDPETIAVYDARAEEYAQLVPRDTGPDATLRAFMAALPSAARVLDLGCGPGRSAAFLAQAGHEVLAVDASAKMVDLAKAQPGVSARVATFDDIPTLGAFDAVWANFSLLHAPRAEFPRHLTDLHTALHPSGVLHIALKLGSGMQRDRLGRKYTYLEAEELDQELRSAGFTPFGESRGSDRGLDGTMADWIAVLARA